MAASEEYSLMTNLSLLMYRRYRRQIERAANEFEREFDPERNRRRFDGLLIPKDLQYQSDLNRTLASKHDVNEGDLWEEVQERIGRNG